jgi:hypothetical protein
VLDSAAVQVEVPQAVVHEADLPDLIVDLANSHELTGQHGAQVDLLSVHGHTR